MTIEKLEGIVEDFADHVESFRYEEAHDKFYHPELVKHENEGAPTLGLEAHREEMKHFLSSLSQPKAVLISKIVSDDMSVIEWNYSFHHKDWGKRDFREVSVQRWKEGKIIHERHHYKAEKW